MQRIRGLAGAAEYAGGPLFGVNGVAVVGHGRSPAEGIAAAIELAAKCIDVGLVEKMREDLAKVLQQTGTAK